MAVEKTYVIKGKPESNWILVDAKDQKLGRLATQIATYLMGKHKPTYTPGVEMGDFVVVVNASEIAISATRMEEKVYHKHSNYPGGLRSVSMGDMLANNPERVIREAVWGMLPHNKVGRHVLKRLKIYAGAEHPHQGQNPEPTA
jgi:large subunit ribosomal protein L13